MVVAVVVLAEAIADSAVTAVVSVGAIVVRAVAVVVLAGVMADSAVAVVVSVERWQIVQSQQWFWWG